MSTDPLHTPSPSSETPRRAGAIKGAVVMTALIAAFFLLREH